MKPDLELRRRRIILIAVIMLFIGVIAVIIILAMRPPTNQFGNLIRIQNYNQKVKNLSSDMKDSMESYLYNIVKKNSSANVNVSGVNDATIRDNSDSQNFDSTKNLYSGSFIIDMASIKQSYQVQYSYSSDRNNLYQGGNPVIISCLPKDQLKYGEFNCTDFVSEQSTSNDTILQYLPYRSLTFNITPDETQGTPLILNVELTIPQSELKGDTASKQATVTSYIQQVNDWIT